MTNEIRS
jgi:predicted  nucleic acid-binding Zn-ribbon protein